MKVLVHGVEKELGKPFAEGGEARLYKLDKGVVAKVYRLPRDPELQGDQVQINSARIRLVVAQRKLPLIPQDLPATVSAPQALIRDPESGFIIGCTLRFVEAKSTLADLRAVWSDINDRTVVSLFRGLKDSVAALHVRGIVLGDFNDRNVLVTKMGDGHIIDVDSAQFAPFRTKVFTPEFVDPSLCQGRGGSLELVSVHTEESDWYAWWVMFFRALFGCHPYGGKYNPQDPAKKVPIGLRGMERISAYHPEVVYPKNCRGLDTVPEPLTRYFRMVFEQGLRPVPSDSLFESFRFDGDGRFDCAASTMPVAQKVEVVDQLSVQELFNGGGVVAVASHEGRVDYLALHGGQLCRNDSVLLGIKNADGMTFLIAGTQSVLILKGQAIVIDPQWKEKIVVNDIRFGGGCGALVAGSMAGFVFYDGQFKVVIGARKPLLRVLDIDASVVPLGFWAVGDHLMVLYAESGRLGYLVHHLLWDKTLFQTPYSDARVEDVQSCVSYSGDNQAWLFIRTNDCTTMCTVFDLAKKVRREHIVVDQTQVASTSWMEELHGKAAIGQFLFSPTKEGVTRIAVQTNSVDVKVFNGRPFSGYQLIVRGVQLLAFNNQSILSVGG